MLPDFTLSTILTNNNQEFLAILSVQENMLDKIQYLMTEHTRIIAIQQLCTMTMHMMKVVFIILAMRSHNLNIHITGVKASFQLNLYDRALNLILQIEASEVSSV